MLRPRWLALALGIVGACKDSGGDSRSSDTESTSAADGGTSATTASTTATTTTDSTSASTTQGTATDGGTSSADATAGSDEAPKHDLGMHADVPVLDCDAPPAVDGPQCTLMHADPDAIVYACLAEAPAEGCPPADDVSVLHVLNACGPDCWLWHDQCGPDPAFAPDACCYWAVMQPAEC